MKVKKIHNYLKKFKHDEDIDVTIDDEERITFIITDIDGLEIVKMDGGFFE